jgi:ribonuclease HI
VSIRTEEGRSLAVIARGIGIATNNQAEYRAAIEGLERARELGATHVLLRSDSTLLIEQLSGRFRVRNPTLRRLHEEVRDLAASFRHVAFEHVPREENAEADGLANEGIDRWLATQGAGRSPVESPPRLWDA